MPITTTGAQLPSQPNAAANSGWWSKFVQGIQSSNLSFTSGPNGWNFGSTGGGQNALPQPPSTRDVNNWLPYLVGGAVLFKLLK
jgi:hypothetical protein